VYKKDQEDIRIQQINAANTLAFYTYIPKRYPGKVTLFKSVDGYRDIYRATKDPLMGWQRSRPRFGDAFGRGQPQPDHG
jgi:hypothetical protein